MIANEWVKASETPTYRVRETQQTQARSDQIRPEKKVLSIEKNKACKTNVVNSGAGVLFELLGGRVKNCFGPCDARILRGTTTVDQNPTMDQEQTHTRDSRTFTHHACQ